MSRETKVQPLCHIDKEEIEPEIERRLYAYYAKMNGILEKADEIWHVLSAQLGEQDSVTFVALERDVDALQEKGRRKT